MCLLKSFVCFLLQTNLMLLYFDKFIQVMYNYINTVIQLLLKLFLVFLNSIINQVTNSSHAFIWCSLFVVIFVFWSNELNLNSVLVLCSYLVWLQSPLVLLILSFQWWVMFLSDSPSSLPDPFLCHCHTSVVTTWLRKTISNTW